MQKSIIRKPISILLSLLMVLSVFGGLTLTASAESVNIDDFIIEDGILTAYQGDKEALTDLVIPDGVKEIGSNVFRNCLNLKSVDLNEVEVVRGYAFFNCQNLSLVKGKNLRCVWNGGFRVNTANLRTITIRSAADRNASYLAVGGVNNAAVPGSYLYVVVRKGEQGNAFEYMTFNCTFIIEEGVDAYTNPAIEADQTQKDGVYASVRVYVKDIDDVNKTVVVSKNESNIAGFEVGKTIIIDGENYTIVAPKEERFAAYKEEVKSAVEDLAQEGDSDDVKAIIAAEIAAIDELAYDEEKTLEENEAVAAAALAKIANKLAAKRAAEKLAADKAAFEEYKETLKSDVAAKAQDGDSEAAQAIIDEAVAAIDALEYDETKTLDENKAAADTVSDIDEALDAQRAADAEPTEDPATHDDSNVCPWCGKTEHDIWWIGFVHSVFNFVKDMLTNVLPKLMK